MIVYGDPQFQAKSSRLRHALLHLLSSVASAPQTSLDAWRSILIQTGQLEQALSDATHHLNGSLPLHQECWTDLAAESFYAAWAESNPRIPPPPHSFHQAPQRLHSSLLKWHPNPENTLTVKIPEGFAFYALFPEQYALAALDWHHAHEHESDHSVAVVGIRSIGTTLSALAAAALRAAGWKTFRLTIRPQGHPFFRSARIPSEYGNSAELALVVDEGPGLSGSSMAAAAEALAAIRFPPRNISFLPGHSGQPGAAASESVRRWWQSTPRYLTELHRVTWRHGDLKTILKSEAAHIQNASTENSTLTDFSAGLWRRACFSNPNFYPAVCPQFERTKFHWSSPGHASLLWKFSGLAPVQESGATLAEIAFQKTSTLATQGWTPQPLRVTCGFLATPWISGAPLTPADLNPGFLRRMARYILAAAEPPLTPPEQQKALHQLQELLTCNLGEALPGFDSDQWQHCLNLLANTPNLPSYGDGRLAPHEWIRDLAGRIWKTDCTGHNIDHTAVGRQSIYWDFAGAWVEWNLNEQTGTPFLQELHVAGFPVNPQLLLAYSVAYAAFRLGQYCVAHQFADIDPAEKLRLEQGQALYRAQLKQLLAAIIASANSHPQPQS